MMKLYGFGPTRSLRALWALREIDAEFEFVTVDLTKGRTAIPVFCASIPPANSRYWSMENRYYRVRCDRNVFGGEIRCREA